jgi:hypothetical protein
MLSGSHNLIGDGTGQTSLVDGLDGNIVGTAISPIDPMLSPLQDNGGPTLTRAPLPGSPAINAGSNALAVDAEGYPLDTDAVGNPRIQNGTVDIGANEFTAIPGDANCDGTVDYRDATILASNWLTKSGATWAMGDFNGDERVDEKDATMLAGNMHATPPVPAASTSAAIVAEAETSASLPEETSYDLDNDGQVGLGDLASFSSVYRQQPGITSESPLAYAADFDGSGTVDLGDLALFSARYQQNQQNDQIALSSAPQTALTMAAASTLLPDDANRDGLVGGNDASTLALNWQKKSAITWSEVDFNGEGLVDDADAAILAQHWMMTVEDLDGGDDERDAVFAEVGASIDPFGLLYE